MCAMDRSQIVIYSQTEFIQYLNDSFSISSTNSFIRNAKGDLIYLSPAFEKRLLNGLDLKSWFSSIPVDTRVSLFNAEQNTLSDVGPYMFNNVKSKNCLLNIFMECMFFNGAKFVRWVFIPEFFYLSAQGSDDSKSYLEIESILSLRKRVDLRFWKVFNLYAYGFTIEMISETTRLTKDQVKKTIKKIKVDCFVDSRDSFALTILKGQNYNIVASNVIKILNDKC
ncbi:hypothetical protein [Klebsiella grimontii]|uniref:hypothetical protein n=1 Tax=Klebsiella grimontii TaxID=2058152 RepID=UPI00300BFC8C